MYVIVTRYSCRIKAQVVAGPYLPDEIDERLADWNALWHRMQEDRTWLEQTQENEREAA